MVFGSVGGSYYLPLKISLMYKYRSKGVVLKYMFILMTEVGRVGSIAAKPEGCGYRSKSTSPSCVMNTALDFVYVPNRYLICHATATASAFALRFTV